MKQPSLWDAFKQYVSDAKEMNMEIPNKYNQGLNYIVTEPKEIGYAAYQKAIDAGLPAGHGTLADRIKHATWMNEIAKRTELPQPLAGIAANAIGVGKEIGMDWVGSAGNLIANSSTPQEFITNLKEYKNAVMNSPFDIMSNIRGGFAPIGEPLKFVKK